jgi:hypothetical protein
LFFHPIEEYTLETVEATFRDPAAGRILFDARTSDEEVYDETLNQTAMLLTSRDLKLALNKDRYSFGRDQTKSYQAGAGFDNSTGQSLSRAPIYYNTLSTMFAFVINFYYTFTIRNLWCCGSYRNETITPVSNHSLWGRRDWQGIGHTCWSSVAQFCISTFSCCTSPGALSVAYKQYKSRSDGLQRANAPLQGL